LICSRRRCATTIARGKCRLLKTSYMPFVDSAWLLGLRTIPLIGLEIVKLMRPKAGSVAG
jgi:hypothetical protein